MSKLTNLVFFLLGTGVGVFGTVYFLKNKYEDLADEEINSVKQVYSQKKEAAVVDAYQKPSLSEYTKNLEDSGYTNYSRTVVEKKPIVREDISKEEKTILIITPDEFDEVEGYTAITLTYFADGTIADEDDEPFEDYEDVIGDALNHFGEYEKDAVYVRNTTRHCDYEILRDHRRFEDVVKNRPISASMMATIEAYEDEEDDDI